MSSISNLLRQICCLAFALSLGCGGEKQAAPAKNPSERADAPKTAAATAPSAVDPKVKVIEGKDPADDRYSLTIEPPAEIAAGASGEVKVSIVPKAPWHMNLDYPTSLAVTAPDGVSVAKAEQRKDDAARLDDNGAVFSVAFTAAKAGEASFTGQLKFAVCQDDACAPITEELEFKVAVK